MTSPVLLPEFKTCPAVFAVKNDYQIMVPVKSDLLFWVTVDGKNYYDHSNGIVRSSTRMHRVNVPTSVLDKAGEYTVTYRKIIDRKPYFAETEEPVSATYSFRPVPASGDIKIYHLSDTHGKFDMPSKTATYFGDDLDLFILNGDVPDHSGKVENFDLIFELCEAATHGTRTCLFSRGNHDTRGFYAENIVDYTPTENGHSYYTFRVGSIWGILMDCGEDKTDDHAEYGHTVCCHEFRLEETEYLKKIIADAKNEYLADGVEHRLVIVHNPFSLTIPAPFDIEQPLFSEWLKLLGDNVKPELFLSGHLHTTEISPIGGKLDDKGQVCTVVVGSREINDPETKKNIDFVGCAVTLSDKKAKVCFTNSAHEVLEEHTVEL